MKKLLLIFTFLMIIGVTPYSSVSAEITNDIDFTCNTTYTEHAVEGILYFGASATEVTITIPENATTIRDNGSHLLFVWFYDDTDTVVYGFETADIFGSEFEGEYTYYINFDTIGVDPDAVYLKYTIPMGLGIPCDTATEDYYNDNSVVIIGYTDIPYGRFGWSYLENTVSSSPDDIYPYDYLESTIISIPDNTTYINFLKPVPDINLQFKTYYSTIEFFDDLGVSIDVYNLTEFNPPNIYRPKSLDIDITLLDSYTSFDSFKITEVFSIIIPDTLLVNNALFTYNFDNATLPIVNFWVDDVIDFNRLAPIGSFVEYSGGVPSKAGYDFIDWVYHDNTPYRYPDAIDGDYFISGEINLYAVFRVIPTYIVEPVDDLVADEDSSFTVALTSLGFNDPIERTIVFGFVVIITSLILLFRGVSSFAILIVVTCELLFFMYLGVMPLFASIIIGLVFVLIGFKSIGGGTNE